MYLSLVFAGFLLLLTMAASAVERGGLRDRSRSQESKPERARPAASQESKTSETAVVVAALIRQLGDPSWEVRENATKRLIEVGLPARKALQAAAQSADAEVAARARRALERIPWAVSPQDPPDVVELMREYQNLSLEERRRTVGELYLEKGRFKALPPLLRVVDYEANEELALQAAAIVQQYSLGSSGEAVRQFAFESDRLAVYWLRGWAWRQHDPRRAREWLSRALTGWVESGGSEEQAGRILETTAWLVEAGGGEQALAMLEKMPSFLKDDARALYVRAKAEEKQGNTAAARKLAEEARARKPDAGDERLDAYQQAAIFLRSLKWREWERKEWTEMLAAAEGNPVGQVLARWGLGWLEAQEGNFEAAAEHYMRGGELAEDNRVSLGRIESNELQAEGVWNRARAMMARGETARLEETLKDMLRLSPGHPDGAGELARFYLGQQRAEEAEKLLDEARAHLEEQREMGAIEEPTFHNNLAWLYVVANARTEEALELAARAVAAAPHEVAFLDTLAEAYFRNGQKEKGLEKLRYALSLEPDNDYLRRQIARFQRGNKNEPIPLHR